jgi:hypothetical protein
MSDLQLGLLGVGVLLVAAVLGYNKWQELQYRRQAEAHFKSRHEDVLMEPEPRSDSAIRVRSAAPAPARIEPGFSQGDVAEVTDSAPGEELLSSELDFIVPVEASIRVPGEAVIGAGRRFAAETAKPVRWEGFNEAEAHWEAIRPEASYAMFRAGLQLVDRRGAVTAAQLAAFVEGVERTVSQWNAQAVPAEVEDALERAGELDRFCAEVDIQIGLNVVSIGTPFTGTKIRAIAEANGMILEEDGCFRRRDEDGKPIYTLANFGAQPFEPDTLKSATTAALALEFDLPRAPGGIRAFEQFRELARQLSGALNARIVDDNRQPLSPAAFAAIQAQLQAVYKTMEARGIVAGGKLALRLFS